MVYRTHPYANHGTHMPHMDHDQCLILVVGGMNPRLLDYEVPSRLVQVHNPFFNCWSLLAKLPDPRHHHGCVMLDGYLYVIGECVTLGWAGRGADFLCLFHGV